MQNEMNKLFEGMDSSFQLGQPFSHLGQSFSLSPSIDIKEDNDHTIVTADIPGSDASNINVRVDE